MQVEIIEISNHLGRHPPFDALDHDLLAEVAHQIEISYYKADTEILTYGDEIHELHYVRAGAVEIFRRNGDLHDRLSEGDIFGHFGLLRDNRVRFPVRTIEDTLIYSLPARMFHRICETSDSFADFVEADGQSRLKTTLDSQGQASKLMTVKVRKLVSRLPVTADQHATVQQAAAVMTKNRVSCLLVTAPPSGEMIDGHHQGLPSNQMVGIVTDRDLRTRFVAAGLRPEVQVNQIMTPAPITIQADDSVFDAMLVMLRNNIHHLPVLHRQHPMGVINLSDIVKYESRSSLYLVNNIFNRPSIGDLQSLVPDVSATYVRMVNDDASARMIGSAMSSIGRSFTQRLLELAEQQLGPPPVPYCFMALGSMARDEQLIVTDQDNALILDDRFRSQLHGAYFHRLAALVCEGLAACGYPLCTGGIMATNPKWQQPLKVWREYFTEWIERPNQERLLNSSIFFDLDPVYGDASLVDDLRELLVTKASRSEPFLSAMARNALNRTPPLGFFRTFVMETDGEHNKVINLKRRGTAPLTDLIRVHALACGTKAQNSFDRLDAIEASGSMPAESLERLRHALEFLSIVRIRHQARDIEQGREAHNNVDPETLTTAERHNLKESFQILSNAQKVLRSRYPSLPSARLQ